ncbi:MAG: hypothetical protein HQL91_08215 [Magnetococcales bacterium]|nr:hypothetical protein [Magnetococcales bacterium]
MSGSGGEWVSWLILIGGTVLALLGVIKIMASGARLLIWMLLLLAGIAGIAHGLDRHPTVLEQIGLPGEWAQSIRALLVPRR